MEFNQSQSDKRTYRYFELENELKCLVISDPETLVSAASMTVGVGSTSDPPYALGLAHFCEHMLFLGTEKYPDEGGYKKKIKEHGGMCNAYTTMDHTNYYFEVSNQMYEQILDMFSQFFISPKFDESCV